jgi:putative endonuclease
LRLQGYRIVAHRHKGGRGGTGEIDIVAVKGKLIAFVEVKARGSLAAAAHALTARQRQRLTRGAAAFLANRPAFATFSARFDAILLAPFRLPRHIKDAWRDGQ